MVCIASAKHCKQELEVVIVDEEMKKANKNLRTMIDQNLFPLLEVAEGQYIFEVIAIAKYFGRLNPENNFLGSSILERAQVEMWLQKTKMQVGPEFSTIVMAVLGYETDSDDY